MYRFIAAATLITVIAFMGFNILTKPLQQKLATNYVDLAKKDVSLAKFDDALDDLQSAQNYLDTNSEEVAQLTIEINRAQEDLFAERDLLKEYGNGVKVALLEQALQDYETPKEMLTAAIELYQQGEYRYAQILLTRAEKVDPGYSGLATIRDYLKKGDDV